jgi:hypothetical protein
MKLGSLISMVIDKKFELKELENAPVDYSDPITFFPDELMEKIAHTKKSKLRNEIQQLEEQLNEYSD